MAHPDSIEAKMNALRNKRYEDGDLNAPEPFAMKPTEAYVNLRSQSAKLSPSQSQDASQQPLVDDSEDETPGTQVVKGSKYKRNQVQASLDDSDGQQCCQHNDQSKDTIAQNTANDGVDAKTSEDNFVSNILRNPERIKIAVEGAKEFADAAKAPLFDYNEEALESLEPEKNHSKKGSRLKLMIKMTLFVVILFKIVWETVKKYGNQKSQELSTTMHNSFIYDTIQNPLEKLLPVHWFLEMNREDVVDRMECLINNNETLCEHYDEVKCSVLDKKSYQYESCMLRTYRKFGREQKDFCISHYQNSGHYLPSEKSTAAFIDAFYGCLQHAGIPKGKKYCDKILGASPTSKQQDYFACYQRLNVNPDQYGELQCRFQNPLNLTKDEGDAASSGLNCIDDLSVSDLYGDTCETFYNQDANSCGLYDTEDFIAGEACCACGGGRSPNEEEAEDPYVKCLQEKGLNEEAQLYKCDQIGETYDDLKYRSMCWPSSCSDDLSVSDSYGDTCESWYNYYPYSCGNYDTDQFKAGEACCACGGGSKDYQEFLGTSRGSCECLGLIENFNDGKTYRNYRHGAYCSDEWDDDPNWCYVSPECEGSTPSSTGVVNWITCDKNNTIDNVIQINDDYYLDSRGKTCSDYHKPSQCGKYDTEKFKASQMCLVCRGGIAEPNTYCNRTQAIIESQKQCYENIDQAKNDHYCDTTLMMDLSWTGPEQYFDCYKGLGLNTSDTHMCDHLYPLDDEKIGGSQNLLKCYEAFNISLTLDNIHEKCLATHRKNMKAEVNEYSQCLQDLGASRFYDNCWLDPQKVTISVDQREFIIEPSTYYTYDDYDDYGDDANENGYTYEYGNRRLQEYTYTTVEPTLQIGYEFETCFTNDRIHMSGYFCWQKFESQKYYGEANKEELIECLDQFNIPLAPELDCNFKHGPQLHQSYQVKEGLDSSIQDNCLWFYDGKCLQEWTDYDCELQFESAQYDYTYGYTNDAPDTYMETQYGHVCEPIIPDFTEQNECIENIDRDAFNQQLNTKLEEILRSRSSDEDFTYERFANNSVYCDTLFSDNEHLAEVSESKYLCYDMIGQPVGPFEHCFDMQLTKNKDMYMYNYFYKYLCLMFKYVELDSEVTACLDVQNLDDRLIKGRDDCLKAYETEMMPIKSRDGSLYIYQRPTRTLDFVEDLTRKEDKGTNLTLRDIEDFLCNQGIYAAFQSSPYKERRDGRIKKVNEHNTLMNCSVFSYMNHTRDNLVVHLYFDDSNGESFKNQFEQSYYTTDYNSTSLVINRTDANEQYFNLTFSEDMSLIQILHNRFYHYKSNSTLNYTIKDEESFTDFTGDSKTTKLFETYSQTISRHLIPDQNLMGEQTNVTQLGRNVTKKIFGIPYKYGPLSDITIDLTKIFGVIKPYNFQTLVKEEILRINSFRINLQMDYTENVSIIRFYGMLDLISELGGLNASVNTMLASFGGLFLINYFHSISSMIKRKFDHQLKHQLVKQNQTVIEEIIEEYKESLKDADATQTKSINIKIIELQSLLEMDFEKTYDETEERLEQVLEVVKKYRPEALKDVFQYNAKQITDKWEEIEHKENTQKRAIYLRRSSMTLTEIVKQIQHRMHFYSIYQLIDNIQASKIKIAKVKYHTRLQREQIEEQQEQIQEQREQIQELILNVNQQRAENYDLSRQNKKFEGRIKKLETKVTIIRDIKKKEIEDQLEYIDQLEKQGKQN